MKRMTRKIEIRCFLKKSFFQNYLVLQDEIYMQLKVLVSVYYPGYMPKYQRELEEINFMDTHHISMENLGVHSHTLQQHFLQMHTV